MFCGGAGLRFTSGGYGALLLITLVVSTMPTDVGAVCPTCLNSFPGCKGGTTCPLAQEHTDNVAALEAGTMAKVPTLTYSLPPEMLSVFTRPVCEAIMSLIVAPALGAQVDLSDVNLKCSEIARYALHGHCSYEDAVLELCTRMESATEDLDLTRIKVTIELLKSRATSTAHATLHATQGVLTFIWAKVGQYLEGLRKGTVRLVSAATKSASGDLTATVRYPASADEFWIMLNDWLLVISSLGLASFAIGMRFVKDTVHHVMMELKETYRVACCLFLIYLKKIETDPTRSLTLASVFRAGSEDTYLAEARINADAFFRTRGGEPRPGPANGETQDDEDKDKPVKWNGEFSNKSKKPCAAFNFATAHGKRSLDAKGCCKFNHVCNQYVDDKGPGGQCGGNHPRSACTYDPAHKRDTPLA